MNYAALLILIAVIVIGIFTYDILQRSYYHSWGVRKFCKDVFYQSYLRKVNTFFQYAIRITAYENGEYVFEYLRNSHETGWLKLWTYTFKFSGYDSATEMFVFDRDKDVEEISNGVGTRLYIDRKRILDVDNKVEYLISNLK